MSNVNVNDQGRALVELHTSGELFVLPTVWDAWSAKLAQDAGFKGLTVGSHPVANAFGEPDGEAFVLSEYLRQVERIADAVDIPVSVDIESGHGLYPAELTQRVLEAGAVGVNIEDTVHGEEGRVRGRQEHADFVAAVVEAATSEGVPFVVNGRTDALVHGTELYEDPLAEAIARCQLMEQAGALSVYPVKLPSREAMAAVVGAVSVAVNATVNPAEGVPGGILTGDASGDLAALRELGVRRISFGPLWQAALEGPAVGMLDAWRG